MVCPARASMIPENMTAVSILAGVEWGWVKKWLSKKKAIVQGMKQAIPRLKVGCKGSVGVSPDCQTQNQ